MLRINLTPQEEILCISLAMTYIRGFVGFSLVLNAYTVNNIATAARLIAKCRNLSVHNNPKLREVGFYDIYKQLPLFDKGS